MIHVHYSNRTEALLDALARNLEREERAAGGAFAAAFEAVPLVVPNRNVETYVKLGLAQARGIAAHLEVSLLRRFLARAAEAAIPGARVVEVAHVEGHLLHLLHDEAFLARPVMQPVLDYLVAAGTAAAAVDRRRCQLAAALAKLFDEYASSRPELLAAWAQGRSSFAELPVAGAIESWQSALWAAIFGDDGLVAAKARRQGERWLPLGPLLAEAEARGLTRGRAVHVFGVSYMARGYHRMLAALGRAREVRIYTLNPCREFWEDLETSTELRRRLKRDHRRGLFPARHEARQPGLLLDDDPLGLVTESENLALRLWGRPGRENVRLLNQLTDGDFEGRFVSAGTDTLLGRLQDDVLDRVARTAPDPALRADGSVTVLRCPGLRRELEVVAAEIWRLLRADPSLRFNDIAVVVPEAGKDSYLSHVGAVFGEAYELPHNIADLSLGGGHRLGEAIELLLALPTGGFSRRELLPLLTHPSVLARFPEASASDWVRLVDELGIVHGADHADHAGTYIARDLYNWDQGLRRLALGTLMTGPRDGDERAVEADGQLYLPADLSSERAGSALSFALLVRSLIADARFAAGQDGAPRLRPLSEWLELVRGMLAAYLLPADDEEQALLGRCLRALQELEEVEIGAAVSYQVAVDLVRRALERIGGARGQYLARGVTVASFVPMRAIPFRAVFVLGLGHGLFPAGPRRGQLDLREVRRAPGDVSPREQDLFLFLETLLCARERLVLSYVARDELTGDALPPSSVLLELRALLAEGYLEAPELAKLFEAEAPPLRRYDDLQRLEAAPLARREHVAKRLGESLRTALPAGARLPDLAVLARSLPSPTRERLERRLSVHTPPLPPASAREHLVVPLSAIRQFLEDPLQGSARFRLRLREIEGDEALLDREEEPFETGALERAGLLREAMIEALLSMAGLPGLAPVLEAYRRLVLREELAGRLPTGLFQAAEKGHHEAILRGWLRRLATFAGGASERGVVRFGIGGLSLTGAAGWLGRDVAGGAGDPIRLSITDPGGRPLEVEIVGRTDLLVGARETGTSSLMFSSRSRKEQTDKDRLRAFIDHVALCAAGRSSGRHAAVSIWSDGQADELEETPFRPLQQVRARSYLGAVISALITGARDAEGRPTGVHDYLLPCEAVFESRQGRRDVVQAVHRLRDLYFEQPNQRFSSVSGPVPEAVDRHEPPPLDDAEQMIAERFGLFFELLAGGDTQ